MSKNKIQALLIQYLSKHGTIELVLPDGVRLAIGTCQEGDDGDVVNVEDYCWLIASRRDRSAVLDSYNLGLRYPGDARTIVFEDSFIDQDGVEVRRLDVV
jgi:hypothetical protein